MYRRVLLCYDGSREGRRALRQGADLVIATGGEAYLLAICPTIATSAIPDAVTPQVIEAENRAAVALMEEGVRWLHERGVQAQGSLEFGSAVDCIAAFAQRIGADLIVLGHKPRGRLARWWSESDEESLLERVRCSILVAVEDE